MAVLAIFVFAPAMAASPPQASASIAHATPPSVASTLEYLSATSEGLQQAIQAMTQASAGPARDHAIQEANRLLLEEQKTLEDLPPDLVPSAARESDYNGYVKTLEQAAQSLRRAIRALDAQPPSPLRDAAVREADIVLITTQETMMSVPSPMA